MGLNLYRAVWYFIHFLFTIIETVCWSCASAKKAVSGVLWSYRSASDVLREIGDGAARVEKIPAHITVLLGGEEPSYRDLAKLVVWSIATGVSFISFYDSEGKLKKNEPELRHEVERVLPQDHRIIWHGDANGYKNGHSGKKIHLKIYSKEDGRASIANACRDLVHSEEPDLDELDGLLRREYGFPDPHLAVYCGDRLNLRGYPPWQIRLTEFFSIGSHHGVDHAQFLDVLRCYNKCEQRVGR